MIMNHTVVNLPCSEEILFHLMMTKVYVRRTAALNIF